MWSIEMDGRNGFRYVGITEISNVADMGDTYNVMLEMWGDMYLPKSNCIVGQNMIQYKGEEVTVTIQYMG